MSENEGFAVFTAVCYVLGVLAWGYAFRDMPKWPRLAWTVFWPAIYVVVPTMRWVALFRYLRKGGRKHWLSAYAEGTSQPSQETHPSQT